MADSRPDASSPEHASAREAVLRAKYLDYCSAQIAERLLSLSPDEVYVLAERSHRRDGAHGSPSYDRMVQMATEGIVRRMTIPEFELWAEEYVRNPALYEPDILGFWEDEIDVRGDA